MERGPIWTLTTSPGGEKLRFEVVRAEGYYSSMLMFCDENMQNIEIPPGVVLTDRKTLRLAVLLTPSAFVLKGNREYVLSFHGKDVATFTDWVYGTHFDMYTVCSMGLAEPVVGFNRLI